MIQVLLLILKIIGITVLVLLSLVLLTVVLVLFVPVFYRVGIVHNPEKTHVTGRVSFLFPLLLVKLEYLKKLKYRVRVFGFAVLDSEKPKQEKIKKEKRKRPEKEKKTAGEEEGPEPAWEPLTGASVKPAAEEKQNRAEEREKETEKRPEAEKPGLLEKIRLRIRKIRETISNICKKIKKILRQKDEICRILAEPETKQTFSFVWQEFKHLLKHVLPGKIKGYVAYGADDPATTGQVLGILSIIYAKTGQLLEIRPNFQEKQLESNIELKGHIQVITLLVIAVKVFFHQELRQLITEIKNVKEIE